MFHFWLHSTAFTVQLSSLANLEHKCAGYMETTGPAGQVLIDSMQDPAATELGLPGEDESADPPEDNIQDYPETFEELTAQQDQASAEIDNITVSTATSPCS